MSRPKWQRYLAYILAWTVFGLFNFSREVTRRLYWHEPTRWSESFISWMVAIYIAAALTPGVLWLGRRWPVERPRIPRRIAFHLACSLLFSAVELAFETIFFIQLGLLTS